MGPQNSNTLDELKSLDLQVEQIQDLAALKPVFYRLDEIAKEHANDFEVQLVVGDVKQHLVNRGTKLKLMAEGGAPPPGGPPPLQGTGQQQPPRPMPSGQFSQQGAAAPPPMPPGGPPPLGSRPPMSPPPLGSETRAPMPAPTPFSGEMPIPTSETPGVYPGTVAYPTDAANMGYGAPAQGMPPLPPGQPQRPSGGGSWKGAMWLGAVVGLLIAVGAAGFLIYSRRSDAGQGGPVTAVSVSIATTPAGASVRINGEDKCTAACQIPLEPGDYQVIAFLPGYEAAASVVSVKAGEPAAVNLTLEAQPQTVRVFTDLEQGKVAFDGQPAMDLQEGQLLLEKVAAGVHSLKITGRNAEASVNFELATAKLPVIQGPIEAKNLLAVAVASFASQARVTSNSGPLKMAVNGQAQSDITPAGVDLAGYQPGVSEIVLGEGNDQKNVKENFTPAPALTIFLKTDQNIGTLIVSTGESDVKVFLNNKEYARRTQKGELRIRSAVGKVNVRVAKDGFENPAAQIAEVKKGGESRLEFALKPAAQFATLQIRGGTPGADVLIDQRPMGAVGADGSFSNGSVLPGQHTIELRRDQYNPKQFSRTFSAGQTVTIAPPDAILAENRPATAPPPPVIEAKKPDLPPAPKPQAPPPPKVLTMADFEQPGAWKSNAEGIYTHRGQAFLLFKPAGRGVFNFTMHLLRGGSLFRGGRTRWFVDFTNTNNYALFEMDDKNFWVKDVVNGKTTEKSRTPHNAGEKTWVVQIEVSPDKVVHKMQIKGQWFNVDSWDQPGRDFTDGKFGFLIQGDDEIGVSDFKFTPSR